MVGLRNVTKRYGDLVALHETSLEVRQGEFLTLLGPSGSGKTTLLNMIAGMATPSGGEIILNGRDVTSLPAEERGMGMVFQTYALMPHMTVFENIAFPLQIRKVARDEIRRRVTEVLELVRLPHVANRKPQELSGGQQQRISIARCIVYRPSLILMDEPLGALDKKLREQMQLEIKHIHTQLGITMLYVTHDQEEALNMSDRIMLMNAGRVEQLGPPAELYFEPASEFVADFIGQSTLLPGEVTHPGAIGTVRLASGESCRVPLPPTCRVAGTKGKVLLRPESLRIVDHDTVEPDHNVLHGFVTDTLITGGTVKHFVTLDGGTEIAVQELTNQSMTRFPPTQPVNVVWHVDAARFLA
ncbi:ABC transporter ATP-binding protein [Caenimonas sp. DR4.4]|uniref:Spermidine/putrescine import ATP-binding protein PotA n=2 Tax=Caenimonas aquaedulcis TaxID=2793270 RepID=A0A931MH96_9BURK|nr:ABC transporter ATP-binding protein [Caenimonas aquaedulcis]